MLTFHELYEQHARDVYRFAYWLCGDPVEAEDITSETFVRAWTAQAPIRTETVKAYLFAIARNLVGEQRRRSKRDAPLDAHEPDPSPTPEQLVEDRLALAEAQSGIQALPETDRAALIMRVLYDMSYDEIARVLSLSVVAAKVKVHRARLRLAEARLKKEKGDNVHQP
jgi:RNA polymerase sigma-70 factor (ECF subfamily)